MNFRQWTPSIASLAALAIALPLLHGCGGGGSSGGPGFVRLVNATTDYSALDLYSTTTSISTSVPSFGAGDYVSLGEGSYTFNLKSAGTETTSSTSTRSVSKDVHNTLLAYMSAGVLTTAYLTDTEVAPTSGAAKLRVFNTATAEAGSLDVYLVTSACTNLASAAATASNVSTWSTYSEITAAAAGTPYHLCVTAAGDKSDLRLDIPSLTLTDQQIVTLVLTRSSGGVLVHGLLLNQQGAVSAEMNTSVRMRLVADAASSGVVTAVANGTSLSSGSLVGTYRLVNGGNLAMDVQINGTPAAATGLVGTPGADLTLLVAGSAAAPTVALIADDNRPSTSAAFPVKLRLVHGLNGVAASLSLTDDSALVADGVAFGTASTPANVAPSAGLARLETTYPGEPIPNPNVLNLMTLKSGGVYTLFLLGDASAPINNLRQDR